MKEKIGNVTLNYEFYKGNDIYSDGDIEEKLLEIVKSEQQDEALLKENDWAIMYHLSPIRHNVLSWYDFKNDAEVLEIGSGCGAISGLLCEKVKSVTAIDLSKRRSTINAYRNKQFSNLEIMVGNFEDIKIEKKFDYVTLIGVFEYSIYYMNDEKPFEAMLKRVKSFLKPDGKLIIAIENKNGIKYWNGSTEDHTGKLFDGIEGYKNVERVRTFSRKTIEKMLLRAGFEENEFYYPYPDYKMPMQVFSDDYLPESSYDFGEVSSFDRPRYIFFDERKALISLSKDGLFQEFANSFIIISGGIGAEG